MTLIQINHNVKMYYDLKGRGQPVVLIAGYGGDHAFWDLVQPKLSNYFNVLVFDNLGIGQTIDEGGALSIEKMAEAVINLINQLELKHPHIVGQSMGGAIAQVLAKQYPDKLGKCVLLNTVSKFNTLTLMILENLLRLEENISFESLLNTQLPWFFSKHYLENPTNIQRIKSYITNNPFPQSINDQRRQFIALKEFDSHKWLPEIKKQTLVIASEDDLIALPEESRYLANNVEAAQFMMIPGGHTSVLERPEQICQALIGFLIA